uniref:Uncharacterized protein n=1 Tax=Panagrolaimus superbus TaxID=310955 RepID=A0A914ZG41_9BILA
MARIYDNPLVKINRDLLKCKYERSRLLFGLRGISKCDPRTIRFNRTDGSLHTKIKTAEARIFFTQDVDIPTA